MEVEHKDLAGKQIEVGSFVVYAALWDRSAVLKYGIVSSLKERKDAWRPQTRDYGPIPTVGIVSVDRGWEHQWELQNDGKEITLGFVDRCLVVPTFAVPTDAMHLLTEEYAKRAQKKQS